MEDTELVSIVQRRVDDALGTYGDQLASQRIEALKRYNGDAYGDEVEGRSKVVTHDVAEGVDSLMPPLLKVFLAGDKVVMCEPTGPEDEQIAEQATDYLNHIFLQKNDGFRVVYTTLKDGLLFKTGVAKVWWDDTPEEVKERYSGLTQQQADILQGTPDIEVELTPQEGVFDMEGSPVYDARVTRRNTKGKCCVEPIPPEEFLIDRYAVKLDQSTADGPMFTAHRTPRRVWEVVKDHPDKKDEIEAVAGIGDDADRLGEKRERFAKDGSSNIVSQTENDMATRPVWVIEAYIRVDYDGDGTAELRKVTVVGETGYAVIDNEEVDDNPFAAWSPTMMPHKFHGKSIADDIADLQRINSTLMRGMLNNLYYVNEPMTKVNRRSNVNIDALLNRRVGGVVEMDGLDGTEETVVPPMMQYTLPVLEYLSTIKEQRTGVTRYSQGLDAEALNKTARGIQIIQDASQQRQELIARCYAEMFMKRLFKLLLKHITEYQNQPEMIRLRGEWMPMDPREWKNNYDMTVTVGLGTGNRDQMAVHAMNILNVQKELLMGGKNNLVDDRNLYNTLAKLIESIGWKSPDPYFTDPQQNPQPPPQPQQDPKVVEIQGKQQLQTQKDQMDHQYRMAQLEKDLQIDGYKVQLEAEINAWKAQQEMAIKSGSAESDADINLSKAIDELDIKRLTADTDMEIKRDNASNDNDMKSEMHEISKKTAGEKGSNGTKVVMSDGTEMKGLHDAFKSIADELSETAKELSRPKVIDIKRSKDGKVSGGTVKPA